MKRNAPSALSIRLFSLKSQSSLLHSRCRSLLSQRALIRPRRYRSLHKREYLQTGTLTLDLMDIKAQRDMSASPVRWLTEAVRWPRAVTGVDALLLGRSVRCMTSHSIHRRNNERMAVLHGSLFIPALRIFRMSEPGSSASTDHKSITGRGGHRVEVSRNLCDFTEAIVVPIVGSSCVICAEAIALTVIWRNTFALRRYSETSYVKTPLSTTLVRDGMFGQTLHILHVSQCTENT